MLLSCRFLVDVSSVNSFEAAATVEINAGAATTLFIQLMDISVDRKEQGFNPPGRRYMPAVGATLSATFTNTDTGPSQDISETMGPRLNPAVPRNIVRPATQPHAQDPSIWSIPILGSDPLQGTVNLAVTLTEPGSPPRVTACKSVFLRVVS
jgi:hypothetical protein